MIFKVVRLRVKGAHLPRFREAMFHPIIGNLEISDYRDDVGHRWLRRALLLDVATGQPIDALPALLDARIVKMARDYMTITGFERLHNFIEDRFYDYQQTWYVIPIDE